jgi:hypothetical protein
LEKLRRLSGRLLRKKRTGIMSNILKGKTKQTFEPKQTFKNKTKQTFKNKTKQIFKNKTNPKNKENIQGETISRTFYNLTLY